ncbi:hypothetical protein KY289_010209 [Solanum tuberosum]|nr:hypothetical protein KY289_010209 [Solanum tuberosum]
MGRAPCCSKVGMKKGPWSIEEDMLLTNYIHLHGEGLLRCGKSCRLRWVNYLRPGIKRGNFSPDEDDLIIRLYSLLGGRWSLIAGRLSGRTDNEIKNHWHTNLSKKLKALGIEPKSKKSTPKRTTKKKCRQNKEEKRRRQGKKARKTDNLLQQEVEKRKSRMEKDEVVGKFQVHIPKPIRLIPHGYSYSSSSKSDFQDKIGENDEICKKFQLFDELLNGCDNNISNECLEENMLKEVLLLTKKAIDWLGEERKPGTENKKDRNELNKERIYRTLRIFSSLQWLRVKKGYPHRRIAGIPGRCLSFRLKEKDNSECQEFTLSL